MRNPGGIVASVVIVSVVGAYAFLQWAFYDRTAREAADPTDSLLRTIAGQPQPTDPWYLDHPVAFVAGVAVVGLIVGLLVAIVDRLQR